jgi:prophage regulatory protein
MNATRHESPPPQGDDRLIPITEVSSLVGLKSSAIYARVATGAMPGPVRLSQRCSRWRLSQVKAWIAAQGETA